MALPYETECAACGGFGCEKCDNGVIKLTGCPLQEIPSDVWDMLEYAELYRKGLAPEPGGVLDQAVGFTAACRFVWAEEARLKAELMTKDSRGT